MYIEIFFFHIYIMVHFLKADDYLSIVPDRVMVWYYIWRSHIFVTEWSTEIEKVLINQVTTLD